MFSSVDNKKFTHIHCVVVVLCVHSFDNIRTGSKTHTYIRIHILNWMWMRFFVNILICLSLCLIWIGNWVDCIGMSTQVLMYVLLAHFLSHTFHTTLICPVECCWESANEAYGEKINNNNIVVCLYVHTVYRWFKLCGTHCYEFTSINVCCTCVFFLPRIQFALYRRKGYA